MGKPTECVRAMLDERGIHWWAGESEDQTRWESRGLTWEFEEGVGLTFLGVCENAFFGVCENDVTPEQAIAATLCEYTYEQWRAINEIVGNAMEYAHDVAIMHPDKADPCWDLSNYVDQILEVAFDKHEAKLDAATVDAGTCQIEERHGDWYCTGCGEMVGTCDTTSEHYIDGNAIEQWRYCPNCGAKVADG